MNRLSGIDLLRDEISYIPETSGVYIMRDEFEKPIYIGKAKNLKKRVSSYIRSNLSTRSLIMISKIHKLDYRITDSEVDALILEAELVKKFQPKYNVLLKDDKSFPYIKFRESKFPQIMKYRGKDLLNGQFFGPFTSSEQVDITIKELQKIFLLRSCTDNYFQNRKRPCLLYQVKRCSAPCVGKISELEYQKSISQATDFLKGKTDKLQEVLIREMQECSDGMEFEKASIIRDKIKAISYVQLKSNSQSTISDADIIYIINANSIFAIEVVIIRNNMSLGHKSYFIDNIQDLTESEIFLEFIAQFYESIQVPSNILINFDLENEVLVKEFLHHISKHKINIEKPIRGEKFRLIENAEVNARYALEKYQRESAKNNENLLEIGKLFEIDGEINRIEVYDNSHISGAYAVGAMIVASQNGFEKKQYRLFHLDGVGNCDDYEMMRFVLKKRFERIAKSLSPAPNLIIIDGGGGHLSSALEVMHQFGLNLKIVAMSKGLDRNAGKEKFHQANKPSFTLDKNTPCMKYLQILRDEAHNYAIRNHRKLRSKTIKNLSSDKKSRKTL